ncbi:MAG: hypothetical protein NXI31_21800 [bacterium]|nr:hypothetical protein [bacterium]
MKQRLNYLFLILPAMLLAACVVRVSPMDESAYGEPVDAATVKVLKEMPMEAHAKLAHLHVEGGTGLMGMSYQDKVDKLKIEAAAIGASAIVVTAESYGNPGNSTMTAIAIRLMSDM